jgi:hypothetical protein
MTSCKCLGIGDDESVTAVNDVSVTHVTQPAMATCVTCVTLSRGTLPLTIRPCTVRHRSIKLFTVLLYNNLKGFGLIRSRDNRKLVYVEVFCDIARRIKMRLCYKLGRSRRHVHIIPSW